MDTCENTLALGVFCGFSAGPSERYVRAATELGAGLAARGHRLVYGAGGAGLMGAVARGAAGGGAPILGVVPEFLRAREMGDHLPPQQIVLTKDLLERKRVMIDRADAFVALPGGYGTLDEVLEVVSMAALGLDVGPLVLLDVDDDWWPLLDHVERLGRRGFVRDAGLLRLARTPEQALDMVAEATAAHGPVRTGGHRAAQAAR
ncbi:TIGR00730 family Rossman fold protein [Streptomyces longwoodensis]|uniref:Cytokinin riboside 5'-monophosphate phosphoribohydrolase n=1 Tax=Streptomyces novoguineensis TaxID=2586640 RepID=A0A4Y5QVG4_9ACTN|nr:Amc15 [Streptomyces novoguineensis]QHW08547.1 TIGR00730 family Rossman fold protein [Streptomyces novoguineensis]